MQTKIVIESRDPAGAVTYLHESGTGFTNSWPHARAFASKAEASVAIRAAQAIAPRNGRTGRPNDVWCAVITKL